MALDTVGVCGALFQSALEAALELPVRSLGAEPEGGEANGDASAGANGSNGAQAAERNGGRNGDQPAVAAPAPVRTPPQAVRHNLAEMAGALERTRAIVYQATAAVAERHERATVTASQAKAAAGACQRLIVSQSLEIHGRGRRRADAQLWVRRAQSGELLLGSSADHHRVVADELFRAPKRQPASAGLAAVLGL
jgi:alkylation response protein AidB-like acyl-CoA dehydrogenase